MADEVVMGLVGSRDIRAVAVIASDVSRLARDIHRARSAAAALLAESFVAAAFLSALQLQKSNAKINFQLECDGPLRGLFVESDASGLLRGYVKNPLVDIEGAPGEYHWRPALGNSGFLSVLRDQGGGEFFRSSVELKEFDIPRDLQRYFEVSEQIETGLAIEIVAGERELLGTVGGILLQVLPGGDVKTLRELSGRFADRGELRAAIGTGVAGAGALLSTLLGGFDVEVTSRYPLAWHCSCSKERVVRALLTLGREELEDMLRKDGKAEATCHFCETRYEVSEGELRQLISASESAGR